MKSQWLFWALGLAQDVLVVRCERLGTIDECIDLGLFQARDTMDGAVPNLGLGVPTLVGVWHGGKVVFDLP